jgi:hypothetical protein
MAQAARGCPWARPARQGTGSGGAFGLAVDTGKKHWSHVGVERDRYQGEVTGVKIATRYWWRTGLRELVVTGWLTQWPSWPAAGPFRPGDDHWSITYPTVRYLILRTPTRPPVWLGRVRPTDRATSHPDRVACPRSSCTLARALAPS